MNCAVVALMFEPVIFVNCAVVPLTVVSCVGPEAVIEPVTDKPGKTETLSLALSYKHMLFEDLKINLLCHV